MAHAEAQWRKEESSAPSRETLSSTNSKKRAIQDFRLLGNGMGARLTVGSPLLKDSPCRLDQIAGGIKGCFRREEI
jgi:hypothetical protein